MTRDDEQREKISRSFRRTRGRYRNFRSRLSQEISKTQVLPKDLQQRLITELDKRLDVDLDELLSSPKLRVKLSPAKMDKLMLELYDSVVQGERGDVFRVIGGGATVGRQLRYIKEQQSKLSKSQYQDTATLAEIGLMSDSEATTPTNLVKAALQRNLPEKLVPLKSGKESNEHSKVQSKREVPKMMLLANSRQSNHSWGSRLVPRGSFTPSRPISHKYTPLI